MLIDKSISDGIVPNLWKVARVTPLYKSDDKLKVENYRPISVLPVLSKVVERVVHSQLHSYNKKTSKPTTHKKTCERLRKP